MYRWPKLYGRQRTVLAYRQIVMQKTLKCPIQVVWVYCRTQWVALFTTDLSLSTADIIEYYGARWKIEAGFKELKQDIGNTETQNLNPVAEINHLNLCMMATSFTWVHARHLNKTSSRRHSAKGRNHFPPGWVVLPEVASRRHGWPPRPECVAAGGRVCQPFSPL
jgi:hypothetical protein